MFAIGLWDGRSRALACRDRIDKAFVTAFMTEGFFASEIRRCSGTRTRSGLSTKRHFSLPVLPDRPAKDPFGDRNSPATWIKVREDGNVEERRYWMS
jgi:hypothetical protein